MTGTYLATSGYTNAPPFSPQHHTGPQPKQHKSKLDKSKNRSLNLSTRPQPPSRPDTRQQYTHSPSYVPPVDPWGRPIPYGRPEGYGYGYRYIIPGSYGSYAPPSDSDGRYASHPPPGPHGFNNNNNAAYPPRHAPTPAPIHPSLSLISPKHVQESPPGSPFGGRRVQGSEHSAFGARGVSFRPRSSASGTGAFAGALARS